ncbi:glycosyl hydrolase family 35 [Pseudoduganella flava]|uniref:Beta-galactosidase n=1 Tax=Pseudoduganella flava TaxID=871742 RepID=A0A562PN56_9BURK|nr:beta-galactosidase [Pseudoduganella flava]QGZ40461.1 glycoside hydrolase family 35 [Pseudoduganella flava]TWI45901.1 glycosyl hydrolase family 35 [Pseudoduganella flava]
MNKHLKRSALALAFGAAFASTHAQQLITIDAASPAAKPVAGYLRLGSTASPSGHTLGANNRYLTLDGKPWMPVMGEFHYTRSPEWMWESELAKMKAAGITVVATYVIWTHHEPKDGAFDWKGNRDLRRFVQLCGKLGLKAVVRVGPWVHAEVRYGGIPDWVVDSMRTRADDPQYLRYVGRLYREIGTQLKGSLWRDGGPVIGIQLENEYNLTGPGQGATHIATLKKLARQAGMDVPFYTVTGWDGTVYPSGEVTPVFGGYPDEPWAVSTSELAPKETYAFRFDSRVSGDLGAQTRAHSPGTAESDIDKTPFLGAEYGAGLPFMYRRRPVVSPDDIASMLPVQLGSGVNLMGYYMFHGGRNPVGGTTLEESTLSGGYNDTPAINYDFQAPLGPDGQQRAVLEYLRPFHYFISNFGYRLAPMTVRKPDVVPAGPDDLKAPRVAVRSAGDAAFVFVNNHVRQYTMPPLSLRFNVKLTGGDVEFPRRPVTVTNGSYFIWPVNFDMDGTRLRYATAQPVARIDGGADGITYVFAASGDIPVEMAFDAKEKTELQAHDGTLAEEGPTFVARPGTSPALTIRRAGAKPVHVLVLTAEQARQLTIADFGGRRRLVLTSQQAWVEGGTLQLRSVDEPAMRFAVYPALSRTPSGDTAVKNTGKDGVFQVYETKVPAVELASSFTQLREAQSAPPVMIGGLAKAAVQPIPESWRSAATWRIEVPKRLPDGIADALLQIDFTGDIGRLFDGTRMADDWYYSGYGWQIGLKALAPKDGLSLAVLPLRADAPVYLPKEGRPDFAGQPQVARVNKVSLVPVYKLTVKP